tara:strand:- start:8040 stop:8576 length:537 start_codon:yes stop_codon:yes gene_type:complete
MLALTLGSVTVGCRTTRRPVKPSWPVLEPAELGQMPNVSVTAGIWAGGQPSLEDLALAQRRGVARVIALCTQAECAASGIAAACKELNLEWHSFGPEKEGPLPDDAVVRALNLLADPNAPPTLLFCRDGSVTAMVLAVHRMVHEGVDEDQALMDARRGGLEAGAQEARVVDLAQRLGA